MNRHTRALLTTASILTFAMAVPHFFVPLAFPWERLVDGLYPPVKWALFAMNFFYSFLLAWAGILSFVCARGPNVSRGAFNWINGGIALFWLAGAVYEAAVPFPMREARWALPCMAALIGVLYGVAIVKYNREQPPE